ncbi:hypothetical protein [Spirosoma agri]|uniref:DUF3575 domain-containing protein n=1 Tax=Spirosoma agri TaxID=1987381 RepID=A0A6M0IJF4_9BACT|nr:hypothetical protein [Spirosoma agri]NEU68436.1 hypothetical protein [Spirosoma agri]
MWKSLFLLLLLPGLSQAQDSTRAINYLEKSVWRLEFFGPGVINESRLGQKTTFVSQLRFVYSGAFEQTKTMGVTEQRSAFKIYPQLSVAGRYFYNFERRLAKGKSTRYNSGNYVTAKLLYTLPSVIERSSGGLEAPNVQGTAIQGMWGFQRTYRKNFYLNLEVGLGLRSYTSYPLYLPSYFTLGYTFPKRS